MTKNPVSAEWTLLLEKLHPLSALWYDLDLAVSARKAALELGLQRSAVLDEWLRTRGLPQYQLVRDWYYVVRLLELSEEVALSRWSLMRGRDPAMYYRLVTRVTRLSWTEVRDRGLPWARWRATQALGLGERRRSDSEES